MKITELQTNDLVVFDINGENGVHGRVVEIMIEQNLVGCAVNENGTEVVYHKDAGEVYPIIVQDDDLIRNGFKFTAVTQRLSDFSLASRRKLEDGEAEMVSNVSVRILDGNTESYDICIDQHLEWFNQRQNTMMFERWGLLFVHKLQNYLREVGFDEVADNFKMDE